MPQPDKLEMCIPLKIVLLPFLLSWWGSWAWLTIARRIQKHDSINKHLHEMLLQAWFSKGWERLSWEDSRAASVMSEQRWIWKLRWSFIDFYGGKLRKWSKKTWKGVDLLLIHHLGINSILDRRKLFSVVSNSKTHMFSKRLKVQFLTMNSQKYKISAELFFAHLQSSHQHPSPMLLLSC